MNIGGEIQYVVATVREINKKELIYYNHNVFTESEYKKIEDALRLSGPASSSAGRYPEKTSSTKDSITYPNNIYKQQHIFEGKNFAKGMFAADKVDGSYIISLFKHADASTVIHETGHYFVETLVEEALANPDNKQLNNDARILLEYAGTNLEAWRNGDIDSKRPAHEILANAFETYIMDGKAPS